VGRGLLPSDICIVAWNTAFFDKLVVVAESVKQILLFYRTRSKDESEAEKITQWRTS
jgi:hypothetical protein